MTATEYCIEALISVGKSATADKAEAAVAAMTAFQYAGDLAIRAGVKTPMDADGKFLAPEPPP